MKKQKQSPIEFLIWIWPLVGNVIVQKWWGMTLFLLFLLIGGAFDVFLWVHGSILIALGSMLLLLALASPPPALSIIKATGRKLDGLDLILRGMILAWMSLALGGLGFFLILFGLLLH